MLSTYFNLVLHEWKDSDNAPAMLLGLLLCDLLHNLLLLLLQLQGSCCDLPLLVRTFSLTYIDYLTVYMCDLHHARSASPAMSLRMSD